MSKLTCPHDPACRNNEVFIVRCVDVPHNILHADVSPPPYCIPSTPAPPPLLVLLTNPVPIMHTLPLSSHNPQPQLPTPQHLPPSQTLPHQAPLLLWPVQQHHLAPNYQLGSRSTTMTLCHNHQQIMLVYVHGVCKLAVFAHFCGLKPGAHTGFEPEPTGLGAGGCTKLDC